MAKTKVEVTAADIKKGVRYDSKGCPLALAIKRATQKVVSVGPNYARFGDDISSLPSVATAFRKQFDLGEPVKPFSFTLSV